MCVCQTLWDTVGCSLPGSTVHGVFQARMLEWVAISYSRGSSQIWDGTPVSCISYFGRQILYHWATWETPIYDLLSAKKWFFFMAVHSGYSSINIIKAVSYFIILIFGLPNNHTNYLVHLYLYLDKHPEQFRVDDWEFISHVKIFLNF